MTKIQQTDILEHVISLYAHGGGQSFSIRKLANEIPITPSVIYHYFKNEHTLLRAAFDYANTSLGFRRAALKKPINAERMLKERIRFQFDNAQAIVYVLKYFLAHKKDFPKNQRQGFIPEKSTLHIEEVLDFGRKTGEFTVQNIKSDAKAIAHMVNGFVLEYYPYTFSDREKISLSETIASFALRALQPNAHTVKRTAGRYASSDKANGRGKKTLNKI